MVCANYLALNLGPAGTKCGPNLGPCPHILVSVARKQGSVLRAHGLDSSFNLSADHKIEAWFPGNMVHLADGAAKIECTSTKDCYVIFIKEAEEDIIFVPLGAGCGLLWQAFQPGLLLDAMFCCDLSAARELPGLDVNLAI